MYSFRRQAPRHSATPSHRVRHPVDHVHHGKSEREHRPGVDVDGVCVNGLADALGATLFVLLALLRWPRPSPTWRRLLCGALPRDFAAGALRSALAVGNDNSLIHPGNREGKQNHRLLAILYYRL